MVKKILISLIFVMLFMTPAYSSDALIPYTDYKDEYDTFIENIPEEIAEILPKEVYSGDSDEIAELTKTLSNPESFFDILLKMLGFGIKDALGMFAALMALVLLSAMARNIFSGSDGIKEPYSFCISAATALAIVGGQTELIKMAGGFISRLLALVNSMLPLVGVLYAAGGNVSTAASGTTSLGFFISVCENLCGLTLMPVVGICLAFSLASSFSGNSSLSEISGVFKRIYTYGLGLFAAIMALVMGMQNQLTAKADSLGARAAKYAVGQFIPVLGNTVGENLRTAAASIEYIRGSVGGLAIVVILLLLLPTLISLILGKTAVSVSSSAAKMLGCDKEGKLLSDICSIYGYIIAVCSICSLLFIYALTLFVRCSSALGG
ncbi:MAG: hypothetical protein U0M06_13760 [Clostridia bacterium]|nr:hypothetical protein [Clostridia bacterium]